MRWRRWRGLVLVAPWLIGFVVFYLGPFAASLWLGFTEWELLGAAKFVGLRNYSDLLADQTFRHSVVNTLYYTAFHVPGVMLLAFAAALLLNQRVRGLAVFRTLFYLPSVTSGAATAVIWIWLLQQNGLINSFIGLFGLPGPNWLGSTQWAMPGLILMSYWSIGTPMLLYLAGLQGIPQELYEAAAIDGAGWWPKIRHVTLPMMTPAIFLTLVLGIIGSFQVFTSALVLTQGGPADATLFVLLFLYQAGFRYFRMGYASAIAWLLFLAILLFTLVQFWVARRWVYYEGAREGR